MAATLLSEGPVKHHGRDYWLTTEVQTGAETAEELSRVTGTSINAEITLPEDFIALIDSSRVPMEKWYAAGAVEFMHLKTTLSTSHSLIDFSQMLEQKLPGRFGVSP